MPSFSVSFSTLHTGQEDQPHETEADQPQRLVRFLARDGRTYYGDAILPRGVTDISKARQARVVQGDIFGKHDVTDQIVDIRTLLAPLAPEHVRTVRCLGLNYAAHAKEVGAYPNRPRSRC